MLSQRVRTIIDAAACKEKRVGPLEYPDELDHAALYLRAMRSMKKLKDQMDVLKAELIEQITDWHREQCEARAQYESTVLLPVGGGAQLQMVLANRWTEIRASREEELRELLGDDFDRCFRETVSLEVAKDVADDHKLLGQVVRKLKKLAGDDFAEWFTSQRLLAATEEFTKEVPLDPADRERLGIKQVVTLSEKK
jgi:hypothetical protein